MNTGAIRFPEASVDGYTYDVHRAGGALRTSCASPARTPWTAGSCSNAGASTTTTNSAPCRASPPGRPQSGQRRHLRHPWRQLAVRLRSMRHPIGRGIGGAAHDSRRHRARWTTTRLSSAAVSTSPGPTPSARPSRTSATQWATSTRTTTPPPTYRWALAPCSYLDHPRGTKSMALPWSVGGLERL